MRDAILAALPWLRALHVVAVISWMAGLLYLPRLFVYHCAAQPGSPQSETFKVMERRLLRAIMNPAMIVAWIVGLVLVWAQDLWGAGWMQAKFALVVAMTWMHQVLARWRKDFAADRNARPARDYRIANEVPTLLMIGIVVLVFVRPW
ncbi:MAG: protoporphyrinogen oxidase HemJ [Alphaproteobacteria bacterium]|nr:protoporphyrinogen oxidase HemJ [Alphaproteobacteria bacterium]